EENPGSFAKCDHEKISFYRCRQTKLVIGERRIGPIARSGAGRKRSRSDPEPLFPPASFAQRPKSCVWFTHSNETRVGNESLGSRVEQAASPSSALRAPSPTRGEGRSSRCSQSGLPSPLVGEGGSAKGRDG